MASLLFNKLENQIIFEAVICLKTGLHIGTGKEDDYTDSPIMRTGDGGPYIPGSSFKGVLRHAADKLSHLLSCNKESCYLEDGGCAKDLEIEYNEHIKKYGKIEDEQLEKLLKSQCPVCQLFGSQIQRGRIAVHDVVFHNARTEIRDGVRIEDGVAADTAKYDYEYVAAGAKGRLRIEVENVPDYLKELIALLLLQMKNDWIRLGGLTSKGFGSFKIENDRCKAIDFTERKITKDILDYLRNAGGSLSNGESWDSFIDKVFSLKEDENSEKAGSCTKADG